VRLPPALRSHSARLWSAFALVHAALVAICLFAPGLPLGDVDRVYRGWAEAAATGGAVVGIDVAFVYPILAVVPIYLAIAFGSTAYSLTWLGIVTALNGVAFGVLIRTAPGNTADGTTAAGTAADRTAADGTAADGTAPGTAADETAPGAPRRPRRERAAWWWLAFLLLLGPIALTRIDSITVPLVIIALLWLRTRPLWGAALLTVATWVKVWPAAVLAALFVASRRRWRILAAAAGTSALIVAGALVLGSGSHVFSFVSQQTARGIQIESPVSLIWLWQVAFDVPGAWLYYDRQLLTFQVTGSGIDLAIALMTPLLALAVASVLIVGWLGMRRGARFEAVFPPLVLALTATLIAFNKVGSPQFISWLAAPVILGLVLNGRAWRTPAIIAGILATLTQVVYPYLYDWLLVANPLMLLVLTARNLLEFVVLGWAARQLWLAGSHAARAGHRAVPAPALQKE
jgi:Glycosyltransferase family 87